MRSMTLKILLFTALALAAETEIIINDCGQGKDYPRAWYTTKVTNAEYLKLAEKRGFGSKSAPSERGLSNLNISVSAQFCLDSRAKWLLNFFEETVSPQDPLVIVDSRLEAHGFLDKQAISWHSRNHNWERRGQDVALLEADEERRLSALSLEKSAKVYLKPEGETGPFTMGRWLEFERVISEREWWKQKAFELDREIIYLRIHQPDHCPPPDVEVDGLVRLVDELPSSAWFHVHCKGGSGRSVSIVSLLDMLHNADAVSFEEIITRQWIVGRSNLFSQQKFQDPQHLTPKEECYRDRMGFLKLFYRFSKERLQTGEQIGWLEYLEKSLSE